MQKCAGCKHLMALFCHLDYIDYSGRPETLQLNKWPPIQNVWLKIQLIENQAAAPRSHFKKPNVLNPDLQNALDKQSFFT